MILYCKSGLFLQNHTFSDSPILLQKECKKKKKKKKREIRTCRELIKKTMKRGRAPTLKIKKRLIDKLSLDDIQRLYFSYNYGEKKGREKKIMLWLFRSGPSTEEKKWIFRNSCITLAEILCTPRIYILWYMDHRRYHHRCIYYYCC